MHRSDIRTARPFPLAAPALTPALILVLATSCVPQPAPRAIAPQHAETRPAVLLHQLALDVPGDLPPATTAATPALAARDLLPRLVPAAAPPFLAATRTADDAARATDCLTAAVYYEARSQTEDGQRAVAQVVLNRVRDRAFPKSVCGVVYQGSTRRTGCQFSFTCDGSMNARREPSAWERAARIATAALAGAVYAPVGSATFYHADYVLPWWAASMTRIGSVGAHIFYRWRGAMENALAFRQSYAGIEPTPMLPAPVGVTIAGDLATPGAGQEQVAGVTIHRGSTRVASAAAALTPAVATPPARPMLVSGVRIHVGGQMPRHILVISGSVGDAIVADESDPI